MENWGSEIAEQDTSLCQSGLAIKVACYVCIYTFLKSKGAPTGKEKTILCKLNFWGLNVG